MNTAVNVALEEVRSSLPRLRFSRRYSPPSGKAGAKSRGVERDEGPDAGQRSDLLNALKPQVLYSSTQQCGRGRSVASANLSREGA